MRVSDTDPQIEQRYRKMLMSLSGEERLRMGCSMFDTAVEIAKNALMNEHPGITPQELKVGLFRRLYGNDFSEDEQAKIITSLSR